MALDGSGHPITHRSIVFAAVGISESYRIFYFSQIALRGEQTSIKLRYLSWSVFQVVDAIFHWKCREPTTWLVFWTVPMNSNEIDFNHLISSIFFFSDWVHPCCRWPRPRQARRGTPSHIEQHQEPGRCAQSPKKVVRSRTAVPRLFGEEPGSSAGLRAWAWPPEGRSRVMLTFCKLKIHYQIGTFLKHAVGDYSKEIFRLIGMVNAKKKLK